MTLVFVNRLLRGLLVVLIADILICCSCCLDFD